jgi:hypothetical protein
VQPGPSQTVGVEDLRPAPRTALAMFGRDARGRVSLVQPHTPAPRDGIAASPLCQPAAQVSRCPHCDVPASRQANPPSSMAIPPRNSVSGSTVAALRAVPDMYGNSSGGSAAMTAVPCPASGPR